MTKVCPTCHSHRITKDFYGAYVCRSCHEVFGKPKSQAKSQAKEVQE